jgi:hypothetical protein
MATSMGSEDTAKSCLDLVALLRQNKVGLTLHLFIMSIINVLSRTQHRLLGKKVVGKFPPL